MTDLNQLKEDLVTANRILATNNVLDSFGHVSIRHPGNPGHFLMARARAPMCVQIDDIMEFTIEGKVVGPEPGKPYSERFIHGAVLEARPDVMAVVHSHSPNIVPFSVVKKQRFGAIMHMASPVGRDVPNWDIRDTFGECTNLLVTNMEMGRDLAKTLASRTAAIMRGHGSVVVGKSLREAVFTSVYMEINAEMLGKALSMGEVTYLSDGEIAANTKGRAGFTLERGWENWCRSVDRPYYPQTWDMGPGFSRSDK
jgi:ribulose-5-phosphate 4-epimerase/fuculose-1-phosphate aldolase